MKTIVSYVAGSGEVTKLGRPIDLLDLEEEKANLRTPKEKAFVADLGTEDMDVLAWYVKDQALVARHEFDLVLNNGVISGIPPDTLVRWPDDEETIESGQLEFESNVSGTFPFRFTRFTHIPLYLEVEYNV